MACGGELDGSAGYGGCKEGVRLKSGGLRSLRSEVSVRVAHAGAMQKPNERSLATWLIERYCTRCT